MSLFGASIFDRFAARRLLRHLRRLADGAATADLMDLRRTRGQAAQARREVDRLLHAADNRLAKVQATLPRPELADWVWRPEGWTLRMSPAGQAPVQSGATVGGDVLLYHDCRKSEVSLRQLPGHQGDEAAPWAMQCDVFGFDGTYLSLVIELPLAAVEGLGPGHVLRLDTLIEAEKPVEIFARLNLRHGPNTEQIVRELPPGERRIATEFDLAHSGINQRRVERAWVDLIFGRPEMNQLLLRDVVLSRCLRAEL
jgi:HAMP domain-containing protein